MKRARDPLSVRQEQLAGGTGWFDSAGGLYERTQRVWPGDQPAPDCRLPLAGEFQKRVVSGSNLRQAVAAELVDKRLGDRESNHVFDDHAGG